MTPEQEVIVRRLCIYSMAPEGRRDPAFIKLAVQHSDFILNEKNSQARIDEIGKEVREQIELDELDRRLQRA